MKKTAAIIFRTVILLLAGIGIGIYISDPKHTERELGLSGFNNDKLTRILQLVRHNYVDSVNVDSIEGGAINNVLQNLDPHSVYLPAQQAQSINEKLEGGFNGVGIEYQILRDTLTVTQIVDNGPAAKSGLIEGDKIVEVNHKPFAGAGLSLQKINEVLHGAKGSSLTVKVLRYPYHSAFSYTIKRGYVDLSSVDAAYMANKNTGYIKVSKFASTTDTDFRKAIIRLQTEDLKALVLDLRGNGGGYLNAATALADEFLPKGKLIVYTRGAHEPRTDYFSTDSGLYQKGKLAVLIDEHSASASEILSGALQDLDRAIIVGRRSFGKGLVQQQFTFDDGSAVNLTVARYYTPSGRSIQKSYRGGVQNYRNELSERMQKGELFSAQNNLKDSVFMRSKLYHTINGKNVYAGGGIMPDIFVPEDTTGYTTLLTELARHQLFSAYVIDRMQPVLKRFDTADNFIKHFDLNDADIDKFLLYASRTLKEMDSREIKVSRSHIKRYLKASAARFKWGSNAYYNIINQQDRDLTQALKALRD
jgi:carboxyl-terminal processing protease